MMRYKPEKVPGMTANDVCDLIFYTSFNGIIIVVLVAAIWIGMTHGQPY